MRMYLDTHNGSAFIVGGGFYRRLGIYHLSGKRYPKHTELDPDWTKANGYRIVPDLYAILLGDKCEV